MSRKKILFAAYGGGHIKLLIPIILALKNSDRYEVIVLALTSALFELDKHDVSYYTLCDFLHLSPPQAQEYGRQLAYDFENSRLPIHESQAYLGLSFYDLVQEYDEEKAFAIYAESGRHIFRPTRLSKKILNFLNVDFVVTTNSPRMERALIEASGTLNIPSICVIDLFAIAEMRWIAKNSFATKLCVFSSKVKQLYVQSGRKIQDIVVTGNPQFEAMLNYTKELDRDNVRNQLQVDHRTAVLWAVQPEPKYHPFTNEINSNPNLNQEIFEQIESIAGRRKDLLFIVRAHPNEDIQFESVQENIIFENQLSLWQTLTAADVVVTCTSTVGLEAILLGKPLVSIELSIFSRDLSYATLGLSTGVTNLALLSESIDRPSIRVDKMCYEQLQNHNRSATQNIIEVINSLLFNATDERAPKT